MFGGYEYEELGIPEMFEQLLPRVKSGQKALDLGIGAGQPSAPLAFNGLLVTGVDIDANRLGECKRLYTEAGLEAQLKTVWRDALGFLQINEEKYDVVTMFDFLMFLTKTEGKEIIKLAYETLAPSGYMWIATMSTNDERFSRFQGSLDLIDAETYLAYSRCGGESPMCFYFPEEVGNFLASMGAKVVFQAETENSQGALLSVVLVQKPE